MFEHHQHPLAPRSRFYWRLAWSSLVGFLIVGISLGIGIWGYMHFEQLTWLDALLNAAMLLGGMGPVDKPLTDGGKLFASLYALFAGIVFLVAIGVMLAPIVHRLLHRFHLDDEAN
jgi:hypothetical protein